MCTAMQGSNLWKHGRQGKPKVHYFHLTDADSCLTWMSKDTKNRGVRLRVIENVRCTFLTRSPPPHSNFLWRKTSSESCSLQHDSDLE